MTRIPACLAAAGAAIGLAFGASAVLADSTSRELRTTQVEYGDLDLTQPAGAAALYRRIEAAARDVCDSPDLRDLRRSQLAEACISRAIAEAVESVNRPTLTTLHQERTAPERIA